MNYLIKEIIYCSCGTSNTYYDTNALKPISCCTSCGKELENPNATVNVDEFARKTLPNETKATIEDGKIWLTTHEAATILKGLKFSKSVSSLQTLIRDKIKTGELAGEKVGRIFRVEWPSVFDFINKTEKTADRGKSTKDVAKELGISLPKLYKYLQKDNHPKYYGIKENGKWIVLDR